MALLATIFEAIKKTYPEASLYFLVKKQYAELLPSLVDTVVVYEGFWKTLKRLKEERFDVVLDLHAVLRTRLLSAFIPATLKHTYDKDVWGRYKMLFKSTKVQGCKGARVQEGQGRHVVDRYWEALRVLGIGCERIIVFQTAFLGDAVLTLPLLEAIRERIGPRQLCVLARPEHRDVFEREGFKTILDDKRGKDSGWGGFWRVLERLRHWNFDLAIVPHRSLRSALLAWMAKIPLRIGFSASAGRCFFTRVVPFQWSDHDSVRNLRLLEALPKKSGARAQECKSAGEFRISVSDKDRILARELWQRFSVDPKREFLIGMAPGSKWETKKWPVERFRQLGLALRKKYPSSRFVLLGSQDDRSLCDCVGQEDFFLNLAGQINLKELVVLISDLKLFISNDSGPMHIACGLGAPTVVIFGPTVQGFGFYPKGAASRVVETEGLRCRPCSLHGGRMCPRGHFLCMRLITSHQVLKTCEDVLQKHESLISA